MASMFNNGPGITPQPSYSDLENGTPLKKSMGYTVESEDYQRKCTAERWANEKLGAYEGEEDTITKIGNALWKIHSASILTRYSLYILPVAALLAIPLV
ncbi:hypothetical protein AC578_7948 [Pseudocercospora eumusae]|uniref:Uncharacterized protein n=1 Tax=Pseudocercospora eumusae TaxID=321146 RepID=A0A139HPG7_9PEZI|nr:hypothetical protein AC578_7948 [Pseudocercospora eumusae]